MRKIAALLTMAALVGTCGCYEASPQRGKAGQTAKSLAGKKILMVFASRNFRDEELKVPQEVFKKARATVTLASSTLEEATGMLGAKAKADVLVSDAKATDWDAIVFVGGQGASEYFDDAAAHTLAQDAARQGKVLGAICFGPNVLANAGVLKGKKATCFESVAENLKAKGALYRKLGVVIDGKLVTADGPQSARRFADALVSALSK